MNTGLKINKQSLQPFEKIKRLVKMKVLSILQPWASLIVLGHKQFETRSFLTNYRGELLIHASAGKNPTGRLLAENDFSSFLPKGIRKIERGNRIDVSNTHFHNLPFGAIIGKVSLDEVYPVKRAIEIMKIKKHFEQGFDYENELAFGDYSPNRFAWLMSQPVLFEKPIPAKGSLGIWNWEREQLSPKIMHASFPCEPDNETIKALNAMVDLAYNMQKKEPLK